ncbi:peroxiredoxin [Desulfovibrio sp. JC022]|uniref:peroxiredoxin n=1 Tax=Desulfovibrio sp. JC022 TaxID=2593642 RepID=UPI0013D67407|nr:peroxiredoxin [Desulfovibrio sp. JC022]NDV24358.1 peroxiredoxin [Desulfovibrio sp. JC022]
MKKTILCTISILLLACANTQAEVAKEQIFKSAKLKPVNSVLKVKTGEIAPDFSLPAISGNKISLSSYRSRKNVVISFVPAAFTPICSDQWPGYNLARELFEMHDAVILGITTDNIPSLHAWTIQMGKDGLWFPVLSDFYPHGATADKYGILRPDGISERAIFIIDKKGVLRYIDVHDINKRPDLGGIIKALEKLN